MTQAPEPTTSADDRDQLRQSVHEIRVLMAMAAKTMARELEQYLESQGLPLTGLQYGVLRILRYQRHTLSELSARMMLKPATLVPVVDALEKHHLLKRQRDREDRRRTQLDLTEHGIDLLDRMVVEHANDSLTQSLSHLSEAERTQFVRLLKKVVEGIITDPEQSERLKAALAVVIHR
ncbi:MAG: MarR family transcriptional regulator [Anaerolineae bacterium]